MASRVHYTKRSIESQAVSVLLCSTDSAMLVETDPLSGELGEWEADDASLLERGEGRRSADGEDAAR